MSNSVTLEEGAAMLIEQILAETDPLKRVALTLDCLKEAQRVAVHEAAICLSLGGLDALHRLFAHYGINQGLGL